MLMQLSCQFKNGFINIDLLDTPVVNNWINHLTLDSSWTSDQNWLANANLDIFTRNSKRVSLIKVLEQYNSLFPEMPFPFTVTGQTQFSNDDLNSIHRFFTSATCHRSWYPHEKPFKPVNINEWYLELNKINLAVHELQLHYPTQRKTKNKDVCLLEIKNTNEKEYIHNPGDWKYLDYHLECNVFLQHCICGKDSFQAYIDDDDCRHFDVMSQWNSIYNSFYIDVGNKRNEFMKSTEFTEWLIAGRKYNTAWQYMPLGSISETVNINSLGSIEKVTLV